MLTGTTRVACALHRLGGWDPDGVGRGAAGRHSRQLRRWMSNSFRKGESLLIERVQDEAGNGTCERRRTQRAGVVEDASTSRSPRSRLGDLSEPITLAPDHCGSVGPSRLAMADLSLSISLPPGAFA